MPQSKSSLRENEKVWPRSLKSRTNPDFTRKFLPLCSLFWTEFANRLVSPIVCPFWSYWVTSPVAKNSDIVDTGLVTNHLASRVSLNLDACLEVSLTVVRCVQVDQEQHGQQVEARIMFSLVRGTLLYPLFKEHFKRLLEADPGGLDAVFVSQVHAVESMTNRLKWK